MIRINLFPRTVCSRSGLILKDGAPYPVTHSLCPCCAKVAKDEVRAYLKEAKKK